MDQNGQKAVAAYKVEKLTRGNNGILGMLFREEPAGGRPASVQMHEPEGMFEQKTKYFVVPCVCIVF